MNRPRGCVATNYSQQLRIGSATHVQAVVQYKRPLSPLQTRQIEAAFLRFHSMVTLKFDRIPHQNAIIRPPAVTPDSVVRLQLREHLRIKSDTGRVELVLYIAGFNHLSANPPHLS